MEDYPVGERENKKAQKILIAILQRNVRKEWEKGGRGEPAAPQDSPADAWKAGEGSLKRRSFAAGGVASAMSKMMEGAVALRKETRFRIPNFLAVLALNRRVYGVRQIQGKAKVRLPFGERFRLHHEEGASKGGLEEGGPHFFSSLGAFAYKSRGGSKKKTKG